MKSNTKQKDGLHFITPTSKIPIYFFTNIYTWSFYLVRIWLLNENASTAVISCFLNKSFVFLYSDETHRLTRRVHHKDHWIYTDLFTYIDAYVWIWQMITYSDSVHTNIHHSFYAGRRILSKVDYALGNILAFWNEYERCFYKTHWSFYSILI